MRFELGRQAHVAAPHAVPPRGVGPELERGRQRYVVGAEQIDELVAVVDRQLHVALLAAELVNRDDRRPLPVAAVGQYGLGARFEQAERSEAELRTLAPAPYQALEPVEERVVIASLRRDVDV